MTGCRLIVAGEGLDVEACLEATGLDAEQVFQRDAVTAVDEPASGLAWSGFVVVVSRRPDDDFAGSLADAVAFLDECHLELTTLAARPDVDELRLELALPREAVWNGRAAPVVLPPELLRLAGDAGIGIALRSATSGREPA